MTQEELLAMLNTPAVKKAMGKGESKTMQDIMKSVEITDSDTPATIAVKIQEKMKEMADYFTDQLETVKQTAVEEATAPARASRQQQILAFAKTHPGMKREDVQDIMDPLWQKGMSLEDAYAKACKAVDVDPTSGKTPEEETAEEKKEREATTKGKTTPAPSKKEEKKVAKTSMKSGDIEEDDELEEGDDKNKGKAKSLSDIINANMNKLDAENPDVFKEEE